MAPSAATVLAADRFDADRAQQRVVALARRADDARARGEGQLRGDETDRSGGAADEHEVARPDRHRRQHRDGRQPGDVQAARHGDVERIRASCEVGCRGRDLFGDRARRAAQHLVAHRDGRAVGIRGAVADGEHRAGEVAADAARERRARGDRAAAHLRVVGGLRPAARTRTATLPGAGAASVTSATYSTSGPPTSL